MSEEKDIHTPNENDAANEAAETKSAEESSETVADEPASEEAETLQAASDTPLPLQEGPVHPQYLYQWDYGTQLRRDREALKAKRQRGVKTFAIVMSITFAIALVLLLGLLLIGNHFKIPMSTEKVAAKVMPQTVLITAESADGVSYGTGFFITQDGYIATNWHVVDSSTKITVTLYSGETKNATLKGYSRADDLAVLKISGQGYSAVTIGDSDDTPVGSVAIAVGNPLGPTYAWSVTEGIVSAKNRVLTVSDGVMTHEMVMMQVDTPVNPGNSGGPICNAYGEVIGILTRRSTEAESVGFALPINGAIKIINAIIEKGTASGIVSELSKSRPTLGISGITVKVGETYYLPDNTKRHAYADGVAVLEVESGSAASGILKKGDIIIAIDGQSISNIEDLTRILYQCKTGQKVTVTFVRDGSTRSKELTFKSY